MKFKTKQALNEFCKTEIGKLDESKLYIIHVKLNIKGIRVILNLYAFLIQTASFVNKEYQINHTALIYGIYKDKILGKTAKYVEATLFGLRINSFNHLIETVNANDGEIWLEEVPALSLDGKERKWLVNFVEKRILGRKYNILKAIGSQTFKSKFLIPLNFLFNLIGKVGKNRQGYFCTEVVKIIIDEVIKKTRKRKETLKNKKFKARESSKIYPSQFFGSLNKPKRFF
jgi:hypothetical protein